MDSKPAIGAFYWSYLLLWLIVLTAAMLLRKILRSVIWLLKEHDQFKGTPPRRIHIAPAEVSLPLLDTGSVIKMMDLLRGESRYVVMFVRPEDGEAAAAKALHTSVLALWHNSKGRLLVICCGTESECRELLPELQLNNHKGNGPRILLDEGGNVLRAFQVDRTPMAVEFTGAGIVTKVGYQRSHTPAIRRCVND